MKFNESVIDEDDNYGFIVTYKDGSVKGFTEEEVNDDELCSSNNDIVKVEIKDGVTTIGNHAFNGCESLTSVMIPSSVTSIGFYAFFECTSLTNLTIPSSVTSIGIDAFCGCTGLKTVTIPNGIKHIANGLFSVE